MFMSALEANSLRSSSVNILMSCEEMSMDSVHYRDK